MEGPRTIDCEECPLEGSEACADCVVTFICRREPGDALIIDAAEERAVRLLIRGGLVPQLRHPGGRRGAVDGAAG
ncbi:MAG TPA: hypothetical protein VFV35_05150 [Acidimicrobiales bacterium]|nr:hypothetical protein [Acidimicrobiales bacterium]